jgi:hypothetical protein
MEQPEHRRGVVKDIEELLRLSETEFQLLQALNAFGCAYRVDGSIREWLNGSEILFALHWTGRTKRAPLQ